MRNKRKPKAGDRADFLDKSDGFMKVNFQDRLYMAHNIIWEMHHKAPIPRGMMVVHVDGDKTNNRIDNLQLVKEASNAK